MMKEPMETSESTLGTADDEADAALRRAQRDLQAAYHALNCYRSQREACHGNE